MGEPYTVLVVGGGPAGIASATVAAEAGCRTALVESRGILGGQIWRGLGDGGQSSSHRTRYGRVARQWLERLHKSKAKVISHATVFAVPSPKTLWAEVSNPGEPPHTIELNYQSLILATGARELFLPFPGWTLPNVVGPGGLEAMAKEGWPVAGKRVVVVGSGPLVLAAADGLKRHGGRIVTVAEQAPLSSLTGFGWQLVRHPAKLLQAMAMRTRLSATHYFTGCWPEKAQGQDRVQSVVLTNGRRTWTVACDYLACAFGLVPNIELPQLLGCKIVDGFVEVNEQQQTSLPNVYAAGELTGIGGADAALIEGELAAIAADPGYETRFNFFSLTGGGFESFRNWLRAKRAAWQRFAAVLKETFRLREELSRLADADTIVCRCEDVRRGQLDGSPSWRAAKLQTRCGMGPCQGRICGAATAVLYGWANDSIRPPQIAVSMGALTGPGECPT